MTFKVHKSNELYVNIFKFTLSNAHGGGVYAVAWSGDGKQLLSASGDKTCKLWDVETRKAITTFEMGQTVDDQQLGCLWSGDFILSVSLSGYINYLDPATGKPSRILKGHNKPITKVTISVVYRLTSVIKGKYYYVLLILFQFKTVV